MTGSTPYIIILFSNLIKSKTDEFGCYAEGAELTLERRHRNTTSDSYQFRIEGQNRRRVRNERKNSEEELEKELESEKECIDGRRLRKLTEISLSAVRNRVENRARRI